MTLPPFTPHPGVFFIYTRIIIKYTAKLICKSRTIILLSY
nr:MAG TPA: hypothetical protein [Caudoviricetes sp.]